MHTAGIRYRTGRKSFFLVLTACTLIGLGGAPSAGAETTLESVTKVYGDGAHNAFTDLVYWHDAYYLCFRHGASHLSMDGEIRIMRSKDLTAWEACATVDTLGDDRDPHFAVRDDTLYLFFGVWDLAHAADHGAPGRGRLRSHVSSTPDGEHWAAVQGIYEPDFWLWRVRVHDGVFYSIGYYLKWPSFEAGEARWLRSEDGLDWSLVSNITKDRLPDEADVFFQEDQSVIGVIRTCDKQGTSMGLRSDTAQQKWESWDLGTVVHCPVIVPWKDRLFVAGRGKGKNGSNTRIWEWKEGTLTELITLPSRGDTAYPGLLAAPHTEDSPYPVLLITWYSQHERAADRPDEASVYFGRVLVKP